MPILQNGEYPEYIYYFKPKKRSLIKKVKSLFKKINLNKVEENEIEEEIINNEVDELRLNEGESFREGIGNNSRRIEGINESTQTEIDLIEQTSNSVQEEIKNKENKTMEGEIKENVKENIEKVEELNKELRGNEEEKELKKEVEKNKNKEVEEELKNKEKNKQPINIEKGECSKDNQVEETINVSYEELSSSESEEFNNNLNKKKRIKDEQQKTSSDAPNKVQNIYDNPYYNYPSEESILANTYDAILKSFGFGNEEEEKENYYYEY